MNDVKDRSHRGVNVPWRYLVASQGESTLREWARKLHFFRFCRAVPGGHAADGDTLCVALEDSALPRRLATDFPDVDTEGRHLLAGVPVHIGFGDSVLRLTLNGADGDPYAVTEADVANAMTVEKTIAPLAAFVIDPPVDSPYCIAPRFWPEFWPAD